jgi:L-ascorbate metabolism protein UlaG (beta-lactamase superfamily)
MEAEEPLVQDIELDVTEVENIVIDGVDSKITGLRIVGKILLLAACMVLLYRNNLQSINILLLIIGVFWSITKILTRTSIFANREINDRDLTVKRHVKLLSLVVLGLVVFSVISASIFLNFSSQVGGDSENFNSSNYEDGSFQNLVKTSVSSENSSFFGTLAQYLVSDEQTSPNVVLPTQKYEIIPLESDEVSITWFGHSSILIRSNNATIIIDPIFGEDNMDPLFLGPSPFPFEHNYVLEDLPPIDYVLISHDHYDHLDMGTISYLKDSKFYVPLGVKSHLLQWDVQGENIQEFDWYDEANITEQLDIAFTPAQHFSGRGVLNGDSTLWGSWVINHNNKSIYFSGDGGYSVDFLEIGNRYGPFDIAILESGQYNEAWKEIHMFPAEVIQAGIDLNASTILPIHNSKFELALHSWDEPLERVAEEGEKRNVSVAKPMIGETFVLGESIPNDPWWRNVSDGSPSFLKTNSIVGGVTIAFAVLGLFMINADRWLRTSEN